MTFGFACSPFLASRTLKQLALDEANSYPLGSQILDKEVYADDILSGDFTLEKARLKQEQIINLLDSGGFKLRKWFTNNSSLVDWLPHDMLATEANLKVGIGYAVLRVAWDPDQDYFYFNLSLESLDGPITKRTVLSKIAKLFDPLGWIASIIITLKIFMQSLWLLTREWDQVLPVEYAENWRASYTSLKAVSEIRIPRFVYSNFMVSLMRPS